MEREIKFRAKSIQNDEWYYGYYFSQDYGEGGRKHFIVDDAGAEEIVSETVGRFTGLQDKNRKDVYEGDVLLDGGDAVIVRIGKPEIPHYYRGMNILDTVMVYGEMDDGSAWLFEKNEDWAVMGNIHENPELCTN